MSIDAQGALLARMRALPQQQGGGTTARGESTFLVSQLKAPTGFRRLTS